jgi:hypothetical protein
MAAGRGTGHEGIGMALDSGQPADSDVGNADTGGTDELL